MALVLLRRRIIIRRVYGFKQQELWSSNHHFGLHRHTRFITTGAREMYQEQENEQEDDARTTLKSLACPICLQPLWTSSNESVSVENAASTSFRCNGCRRSYHSSSRGIINLTIPGACGVPLSASVFENPIVARFYDKSYRDQVFQLVGFPGFDEEFTMAQEILRPCFGKAIMDLSCAGGTLTRKFAASNAYKLVIASDYSEAMLNESFHLLAGDPDINVSKVVLVKADAGRLPFTSSSLAAVHTSAAIHCWPQPLHAVAEIARLLQPGGIFVASTFLFPLPPPPIDKLLEPLRQQAGTGENAMPSTPVDGAGFARDRHSQWAHQLEEHAPRSLRLVLGNKAAKGEMPNGISLIAASPAGAATASTSALASSADRANSRLRKPSPAQVLSDDYDFCGPTAEEVEAASKELGNVFAGTNPHAASAPKEVVVSEIVLRDNAKGSSSSKEVVFSAESESHAEQQRSGATVAQCVDLFQRNSDVQAAVMSLSRDPALWNAFVRNERVQELLRGNRERFLAFAGAGRSLEFLHHHEQQTNPFLVAFHWLRKTLYDLLDSLVDVVHEVFAFADRKLFGGRESEPLDRSLKACMVLTILLFSLVLLNRRKGS
ncbi:hypothetical protein SELMODRAFT_402502 [Selaginella moellendorffii]|uniref:Methyltransferase type 11 domain-containing protein n=2 Tax=Selaginella moellendorffii TaxID=88036 RepID=D8QQV3_SELML|nr:hypothetical protein SELMODRAFT_402502 [Selaginella moellendorffii]